ncbi:SLC13 family permease, partial [Pseudactinotalea sp.]|uniref:SLC13 family permease n=1 Tax=Pseudactinotalea sp. TaxID=1926260 RepID=UPI003B3B16BF
SAIVGGALAPTSIVGITVMSVARSADIPYNPALMFALSIGINALVVAVAFFMFGGRELIERTRAAGAGGGAEGVVGADGSGAGGGVAVDQRTDAPTKTERKPLTAMQLLVLVSIPLLIVSFFLLTLAEVDINLGVVALVIAVAIALIDPKIGKSAMKRIDWNTILLLGGIITYVGVLTRLGAIDQLGEAARSVSSPLVAAFVICVIAALVSAFASTIGIIGALVPLAVPLLVPGGGLEMTGFIYALAISASLVDCAPFGTTGATIVASTVEEHRARVNRNLTRWGLSMVIIGPVVTLATMVVPFMIAG